MILLATEQLDQSKRMALGMADVMNPCSELTRESQEIQDLEALHKRLTAAEAIDNVVASRGLPLPLIFTADAETSPHPGCSCFCLWPNRERSSLDFYSSFAHLVPPCHIPHVR
jgi:hypothetical protein